VSFAIFSPQELDFEILSSPGGYHRRLKSNGSPTIIGKKREKALCARPKGLFSFSNYRFWDCADFENDHCLSMVNTSKKRYLFKYIMSQKTDPIAILKLALHGQILACRSSSHSNIFLNSSIVF
jgi:hypothetical protein